MTIVKYAGDDWRFPIIWRDKNHNPIDLTNSIISGLVGAGDTVPAISLTEDNGGIIEIDRVNGTWTSFVGRTLTVNLLPHGTSQVNARLRIMVQDSSGVLLTRELLQFYVVAAP